MTTQERDEYNWAYFSTDNIITELISHLDCNNDELYIKMLLRYQEIVMRALKAQCLGEIKNDRQKS